MTVLQNLKLNLSVKCSKLRVAPKVIFTKATQIISKQKSQDLSFRGSVLSLTLRSTRPPRQASTQGCTRRSCDTLSHKVHKLNEAAHKNKHKVRTMDAGSKSTSFTTAVMRHYYSWCSYKYNLSILVVRLLQVSLRNEIQLMYENGSCLRGGHVIYFAIGYVIPIFF